MLCVKMNKDEYNKILSLLPDIYPWIRFSLKAEDYNAVLMGFCDSAPCIVQFDVTENEYNEMLDELNDIEIDAFNITNDTYTKNAENPAYQKYLKYGFLYNILFNAEII